jgi:stage II sporulation protein D
LAHAVWGALLALAWALPAAASPEVRVRIVESTPNVRLAGERLEAAGRPLGAAAVTASAGGSAVRLAGRSTPGSVRVDASAGVVVNGRWFPGAVSLVPRGGGRMDVVNVVPLEAYVERSVASETYADWPAEALKAQAVIARTYALHHAARRTAEPYDLDSHVLSQRYDARIVAGSVRRASQATAGEYLAYAGEPILAVFHSCAGGRTAAADEVWSESYPYLAVVASPDDDAPDYFWSYEIGETDAAQVLREHGYEPAGGAGAEVLEHSASGRVARLRVLGAELRGRDLRELLGGRAIKSTLFEVRAAGGRLRFMGSGAGHGVGLSQWGARQMASKGKRYDEILEHYYPQSQLRTRAGAHAAGGERRS